MKRSFIQWLVIAAMALTCGARAIGAEESSDAPSSPFFGNDCAPFLKLGRGLSNFAFGWMEIPINMKYGYQHQDQGAGLFGGFVLGAAKGLGRTAVGLYEAVTFWLPQPDYYQPMLPTLEYFQRGHEPLPLE